MKRPDRRSRSRAGPGAHVVEWTTIDDGHKALLADGGDGIYFANYGDDVHAVGTLAPPIEGCIGCIVIRPDRTRVLARVAADPLAE